MAALSALTLGSGTPHLLDVFGGASWRTVIDVTSFVTLVGGIAILVLVREGPFPFAKGNFDVRLLRKALISRPFLYATGGYLGHMWELYAMWAWILIFARGVFGQRGDAASILTFCAIAAGTPACIAAGVFADRIGRTTTTMALMLVSGVCAALIGFTYHGPDWLFVIISIVWGMAVIADSAQFSVVVTEIGHPNT